MWQKVGILQYFSATIFYNKTICGASEIYHEKAYLHPNKVMIELEWSSLLWAFFVTVNNRFKPLLLQSRQTEDINWWNISRIY